MSPPRAAILALLLAITGCTARPPTMSVTDRATVAACRSHADQVYDRLNRGAIYSVPQTYAPNSSTGLIGDPTGALSDAYAHSRMIDRCVSGTSGGTSGGTGAGAGPGRAAPSFSSPGTGLAR